ncbi:MAG: hypothetical protein P8J18_05500 [Halieaceae bacterium]|nr:hypothetical protein [Halieaceae bacterium]
MRDVNFLRIIIFIIFNSFAQLAISFGVDVCFNDPEQDPQVIRNCIAVNEYCREQPLEPEYKAFLCRVLATSDSLSGLSGTNAIIGGRSLVHSDSVYLIAQLNGFSAWQAYQIMIYSEATDQSSYEPFDKSGSLMVSQDMIEDCYQSNMESYKECLALTPRLMGLYKFNDESGGQLLHLHSRYSESEEAPPTTQFPADYFSARQIDSEVLLSNLKAWTFGMRDDLCVSGITKDIGNPLSACLDSKHLDFPMNFFSFGVGSQVPFQAKLGTFVINENSESKVLSEESSFSAYIPHDTRMAKLGIFLHTLTDRVSHHMCTDRSWFYEKEDGNFNSVFPSAPCGQGGHFLWHVWEQGTDQYNIEDQEFRTMEIALAEIWNVLSERAIQLSLMTEDYQGGERRYVISQMIEVLGIYDPALRLGRMTELIESFGFLPLPGHGSKSDISLLDWLDDAGAFYE